MYHPPLENGTTAVDPPSSATAINGHNPTTKTLTKRTKKKKAKASISDYASSASSNNCHSAISSSQQGFKVSKWHKRTWIGSTTTRKCVGSSDVNILGLHLGMSIAAFLAQVLERRDNSRGNMSAETLSKICILAVRESLVNVSGNKYNGFMMNFENSFQSTLMTLRLISESSENILEQQQQRVGFREGSLSVPSTPFSPDISFHEKTEDPAGPSRDISFHEKTEESLDMSLMTQQLVLHDGQIKQQLSTIEKSVIEQTRSNDLKTLEISLTMKKLQLKERQLALNSDLNLLQRWKLSMGFSKAAFNSEKFKTQLKDARQVELLRKCLDFLVSGLIIMLLSIAYGTYNYSHRRIIEATEACSPSEELKSWWMPKQMSNFNTGLQLLKCQIQVLSRMLFGTLLIASIAILLIQRSSSSHHTMPVTFILLLLGVACGYAGKFCIDTLGGSGNHWLIYWEALCLLHFISNIFNSTLFIILNGPITVAERVQCNTLFPYWIRRLVFYGMLLVIPLLCGFMPFASPREWINHFSSQASGFLEDLDD